MILTVVVLILTLVTVVCVILAANGKCPFWVAVLLVVLALLVHQLPR